VAAILGESNMSSFDWSNKKNLTPYRGLAGIDAGPRPRILYFAPKEFWPPDTGAKVRNYYLARGMAAYADVTYLAFSDRRDTPATESVWFRGAGCYGQRPGSSDQEMSAGEIERIVTVRRDPGYRLSNILLGAIGRTPLTVLNYTTADMSACLAAVLEEGDFDIVHLAGLQLSAYLPIIRGARTRPAIVSDWHNVESELMWRYSKYAPSAAHRLYARATARRLRDLERQVIRLFDAHIVVSARDQRKLLELAPGAPVYVVENGVDIDRFSDKALESAYHIARLPQPIESRLARLADGSTDVDRQRVLFVGSMDYHANEDAVLHFASDVWPCLRQKWPRLGFTIAGRRTSDRIRRLSSIEGVEVTGTVHDVRPFYREAVAAVAPLRVGGGSRLKILEAMAAGVPVVASSLGAEGLEVANGQNILLADSPDEFLRALSLVCEDSALWRALSTAGRELARHKYSWTMLGQACGEVHQRILDERWKPLEPTPIVSTSGVDWASTGLWIQEHGKIG
jgi:glycosyltransferase involved in cell wall biosynthesis